MLLGASPIASADLKIGDCFLHVEMSASPITIHEAKTTSFRWARRGGKDGIVRGAFIRRNTERFVGLEQVDGTGLKVLLDDVVLVRINIQGNHICDSNPEIVSWLFDEIIEDDPARLFLP
jgi:hypothetical protein